MKSWNELKYRINSPGRICYGFFHPALPDDPVVFIEVAMTDHLSSQIGPLVTPTDNIEHNSGIPNTAIFYAIVSTKKGLSGIDLGHLLIKRVALDLQQRFPNLITFSTLSPVPGFRKWLDGYIYRYLHSTNFEVSKLLLPSENELFKKYSTENENDTHQTFARLLSAWATNPVEDVNKTILQKPLSRILAHYIVNEKKTRTLLRSCG